MLRPPNRCATGVKLSANRRERSPKNRKPSAVLELQRHKGEGQIAILGTAMSELYIPRGVRSRGRVRRARRVRVVRENSIDLNRDRADVVERNVGRCQAGEDRTVE